MMVYGQRWVFINFFLFSSFACYYCWCSCWFCCSSDEVVRTVSVRHSRMWKQKSRLYQAMAGQQYNNLFDYGMSCFTVERDGNGIRQKSGPWWKSGTGQEEGGREEGRSRALLLTEMRASENYHIRYTRPKQLFGTFSVWRFQK